MPSFSAKSWAFRSTPYRPSSTEFLQESLRTLGGHQGLIIGGAEVPRLKETGFANVLDCLLIVCREVTFASFYVIVLELSVACLI